MSDADPPIPVPPWLSPLRSPLGIDDLCLVLSRRELDAIADALDGLGLGDAQLRLVHRDGSPWIELDVVEVPERYVVAFHERVQRLGRERASRRFALWRYTGAVYELDEHGAVPDDPIYRPRAAA